MIIRYDVGVGSGSAQGEIIVDDNATDDEIRAAITDDLYYFWYERV